MKKANRLCLVPDLDVMYVGRTAWSPSSHQFQNITFDRDRSGLRTEFIVQNIDHIRFVPNGKFLKLVHIPKMKKVQSGPYRYVK